MNIKRRNNVRNPIHFSHLSLLKTMSRMLNTTVRLLVTSISASLEEFSVKTKGKRVAKNKLSLSSCGRSNIHTAK